MLPELDISAAFDAVAETCSSYCQLQSLRSTQAALPAIAPLSADDSEPAVHTASSAEMQKVEDCTVSNPEDLLQDITLSIQNMAQEHKALCTSRCRIDSCETDVADSDTELASSNGSTQTDE